ncbi:MAG: hypothetical protein HKN16_05535 [Saprospiraceae bacterium]|nr:hypothetical protein [Saprospiraceae bacterium]
MLLFLMLCPLLAQSQEALESMVLKGLMDDCFPVSMELVSDNKRITGSIGFDRQKLDLAGEKKEGEMILNEMLNGEEIGSSWKLKRSGGNWIGFWTKDRIAIPVKLSSLPKEKFQPSNYFLITSDDQSWNIILQSLGSGKYEGTLYSFIEEKFFHLKGNSQKGIMLEVLNDEGEQVGRVSFPEGPEKKVGIQWNGNKTQFVPSKNYEKTDSEVWTKNTLAAKINFLVPVLADSRFNNWMKNEIGTLIERAQIYNDQVESLSFKAHLRNSVRASGEVQVQQITDKWILGRISYWDSWSRKEMDRAFCFDLNKGKEVDIKAEMGLSNSHQEFVITELKQKVDPSEDPEFNSWLENIDEWNYFPRPDGLWVDAGFHPVYGTVGLLLVESKMKSLGMSEDLIESFK